MKRFIGKSLFILLSLTFILSFISDEGCNNVGPSLPVKTVSAAKTQPSVTYSTHVQSVGWQKSVKDGAISGTTKLAKRLEGIKINLENNPLQGVIEYRTHVEKIGWMDWKSNNALSGTTGESKRLEAIEIRLTGELAKEYDIYYRVHAEKFGWLDWTNNGKSAGTEGYAYRLEAIEIKLVKKGERGPSNNGEAFKKYVKVPSVSYQTHIQSIGWQGYKKDGQVSGTFGQAKRLEGIRIKLSNLPHSGGIRYRTHVQSKGWMPWLSNNGLSGTTGESKRLEAIEIELTGDMAKNYDVYYRVHAQTFGWLGWAKNGESAGSEGYAKRLEGIEVKLVKKGNVAPGSTANAFKNKNIKIEKKTVQVTEKQVAYKVTEETSPDLLKGEKIVKQKGKNGFDTVSYEVTYTNGKETNRKELSRKTTKPVNEIVRVGNKVASKEIIVTVEGNKQDLVLNEKVQLYSEVLPKESNQEVVWQISGAGGNISQDGIFTAGDYGGLITVNAMSKEDGNVYGSVQLNVLQPIAISGYLGTEKNLIIESKIYGKDATEYNYKNFKVGDYLYTKMSGLTPRRLPDDTYGIIESLDYNAFYKQGLESVSVPNSVKVIGNSAFSGNKLTSFLFPDSLESIEYGAFRDNLLTSISIPDSVTSLGTHSFISNQLTEVYIPDHITELPEAIFMSNNLSEFEFPDSLIKIGDSAFKDNYFKKVVFQNPLETIGSNAFSKNFIEEVSFPETLQTIGYSAFEGNFISSLVIPDSVIRIERSAFNGNNIGSLILGNAVEFIGDSAFYSNSLKEVNLPSSLQSIGVSAFAFNKLEKVIIPEGVNYIGRKAFYYNKKLNYVVLPGTLKVISESSFSETALNEITIPEGVEIIEPYAFKNNNLNKISIGNGVEIRPNILGEHNYFRDAYEIGGAGTYVGSQNGMWEKTN